MIHSFGIFRKQIFFILLIMLFLPPGIYARGGKDNTGQNNTQSQGGTSASDNETKNETSQADPAGLDGSIFPDTGPVPLLPGNPPEQNNTVPGNEPALVTPPAVDPVLTQKEAAQSASLDVTEMDIRTSTLSELADWCRSLGLSEGGTRDELARRLREYYSLGTPETPIPLADDEKGAPKTIVIESARSTEYFTLQVVDEEYARLVGNVVISLKEGDTVHRIKAWEIIYNRTRNTMTARGGVEYFKEGGDTIETFRGDSLTVNLDTWAGVFTDGASERSISDDETAYRFEGNVISRSEDDVTVLKDATITNAKNEKNYWSIHASKIWLMPGSDWAIFNAILKVGEIPLLYIPFFFLPADEIVFHPVIGYRSREGNFFQTTTYILGRPKASTSTEQSITKILGSGGDMERTREGLFLRSTGKKARDPNDTRLSILFDAYANLGIYLGTELELPKKGILNSMNLSFGIGFTRDIHEELTGYYTPFAPDFDGSSNWNSSKLFSLEVPFRYRLKTSGGISGKAGNLSWDIPFYSDPFVEKDFMNRSEEMDWANMIKRGSEVEEDLLNENALSSYEMRLTGSSNPPVTALNPYISQISISNISSFLTFKTRNTPDYATSDSPDRVFFFPDKFTLISVSSSISGTPYTYGTTAAKKPSDPGTSSPEDSLQSLGVPRSPWDEIPDAGDTATPGVSPDDLVPPPLKQTFTIPTPIRWPSLTLGYNLNPGGALEMQYNSSSANWLEPEDVNWGDISSVLSLVKLSGNINLTARDDLNYYTITFGISGDSSWKGYSYINPDSADFNTQVKIDNANLTNYRSTYFTTSSEFTTTIRPLPQHAVWGNSSVKYTLKNLLVKTVFDGTAEDPDWNIVTSSWDKDNIETHKFTTNIAALVWDKNQSFVLDTDLPPREGAITTTANLRFWYTETYINGKIRDPFEVPIYDPYTFTETLRFGTSEYLRYSMVYDPEADQITSISAGLGFKGFTATFSAAYQVPYDFNPTPPDSGWKLSSDEKELLPKDFILGYNKNFGKENLWKNRISFLINVGSSLNFDLQRYTYSSFTFNLGATLKIKDILDISVSTKSANSVIYRYVQDIPFFSLPVTVPGEKNVFKDLINSFRFDNMELRKSSGFKLKELALDLTHYMGDWNMNLNIMLAPYLDMTTMPYNYKFNTQISFLVTWLPISEIKSEIKYDKDDFTFR